MPTITFYMKPDVSAGTSAHGSLQDGGNAPATGDTSSQFNCGTALKNTFAEYLRAATIPPSSFTSTVQPDGVIDNVHGDCLRSENTYRGQFAAGTWTFTFGLRPNIVDANQPGFLLRFRVFRSTDPGGLNTAEVTTATVATGLVTDNTTNSQSATGSWSNPAFSLNNEYLFIELAGETQNFQAASNTLTWILQQGNAYTIVTSPFTLDPAALLTQQVHLKKKKQWRKKRGPKKRSRWQPPNGTPPAPQPFVFWFRKKKWRRKPPLKKKRRDNQDWIAYAPATSPPLPLFPWPKRKRRRKYPKAKKYRHPHGPEFYRSFAPALCGHNSVFPSLAASVRTLERIAASSDSRILEGIANFKKASPNRAFESLFATAKEFEALTAKAPKSIDSSLIIHHSSF
jgi:hypothetical protein